MPEPAATATMFLTQAAATAATEKVVQGLLEVASGPLKKKIKAILASSSIKKVATSLHRVRYVKTLWQIDKEVDIKKFYCPTRVAVKREEGEVTKIIRKIADFEYRGNIVVQGTAGQGKSIFMRYLTMSVLANEDAFPIFVELRQIKDVESLLALMIRSLADQGVELTGETLVSLSKSGRLKLFLDGFDEVPESRRQDLVADIESLAERSGGAMQIIVTSRPNSGIEYSSAFRIFSIAFLSWKAADYMIRKLMPGEAALHLIAGVSESRVRHLLTTPLMVALMIVRYSAEQSIPKSAMAFYDNLFMILLCRHDNSKPGFIRNRKSRLGDAALYDFFCALSFISAQNSRLVFTELELLDAAQRAQEICRRQDVDSATVVSDITKITCLLVEEGGVYSFIHRSVCEFHAAQFIHRQEEKFKSKFYDMCLRSEMYKWRGELNFLQKIDEASFCRYYWVPLLERNVSSDPQSMFKDVEFTFDDTGHLTHLRLSAFLSHFVGGAWDMSGFGFEFDFNSMFILQSGNPGAFHGPLSELWQTVPPTDEAVVTMIGIHSRFVEELARATRLVEAQETRLSLLDS